MSSTSCTHETVGPRIQSQHGFLEFLAAAQRSYCAICHADLYEFRAPHRSCLESGFDKKLVVSAGYAINANPAYYNLALLVADGAPVTKLGAFLCGTNACLPSNGSILNTDFRTLNLPSLPTGGDPGQDVVDTFPTNFRTPYVQTWTLGIQHQIGHAAVGEVRYVGSKTTDDFQSIDANPFLLPVVYGLPKCCLQPHPFAPNPTADGYGRPNCNYSNLIETGQRGWANYNALEFNLTIAKLPRPQLDSFLYLQQSHE